MDELQLLREMRKDIPNVTDAVIDGGRQKLFQRIDPRSKKKARRRTKALRITFGSVATLGLVTALVAGNVVGLAGWRGAASAEAAEVLINAAELTIKTSDPIVGPGQYLKIDSTNLWSSGASQTTMGGGDPNKQWFWLDTERIASYIPANREDEWVMVRSGRVHTKFFDEGSKKFAEELRELRGDTSATWRGKGGSFQDGPSGLPSDDELGSMSRDPYLLLNSIYKKTIGIGDSPDAQAMVVIANLLRTGLIPADLRAALYKALAMIPGVTVVEQEATLDGQIGIAIGRVDSYSLRKDIIIDPLTGLMIGERTVTLKADGPIPAGTAGEWTTIHTSVVDSAP